MNNKGISKLSIIFICISVVLLVTVGVLVGYILGNKKSANQETTATTQVVENTTTEVTEADTEESDDRTAEETTETTTEEESEDKTEATTEKASGDKDASGKNDKNLACYVKMTAGDGWESGSSFTTQYNAVIHNKSKEDIKGWEVKITGVKGGKIEAGWNGKFKISGDTLTITAESYNETISAKGMADIGFQLSFKDKGSFANVSDPVLYVNGEEYTQEYVKEEIVVNAEPKTPEKPASGSELDKHGKLSLKGTDIVDANGEKYRLKGVSTHGLSWFPEYVNKASFDTIKGYGGNLIRLAMYTAEGGGYCTDGDKDKLKKLIDDGVTYATELGMYVIIDWHILSDSNPQMNQDEAEAFFEEMSIKYQNYDNVLYEICNEPNSGTSWADVKEYAEDIIPIIRKNDKDAIILVGTPTWCQDVDEAAKDPLTGFDNVMYTVHFYAATHKDNIMDRLKTAHDKGLPIFISEFSLCEASGNGEIDYDSADKWFDMLDSYNISYAQWNLANKDEASSLIAPDCKKTDGWKDADLSETGKWMKKKLGEK